MFHLNGKYLVHNTSKCQVELWAIPCKCNKATARRTKYYITVSFQTYCCWFEPRFHSLCRQFISNYKNNFPKWAFIRQYSFKEPSVCRGHTQWPLPPLLSYCSQATNQPAGSDLIIIVAKGEVKTQSIYSLPIYFCFKIYSLQQG